MLSPASTFRSSFPLFLVLVSFFGLFFISVLTLSPAVSQENFIWRKPLIGIMFASVCVLGILAVFFPNECSRVFDLGKEKKRSRFYGFKQGIAISKSESPVLRGHHPNCEQFSSHVFRVGSKIFCATCSGLFLGALIVLAGVALYSVGNLQMEDNAFSSVLVGIIGVSFGLLQSPLLNFHRSMVRVFSSAFLAIGSFLILMGIDELTRNVFLDVFLVFLTVFWLVTRISLSQWEHEKICSTCNSAFCDFFERTKKGV
jgi:hypothetical protein